MQRFDDVGFSTLGGDGESGEADRLRRKRELLELLAGSFDPRDWPGVSGHLLFRATF